MMKSLLGCQSAICYLINQYLVNSVFRSFCRALKPVENSSLGCVIRQIFLYCYSELDPNYERQFEEW